MMILPVLSPVLSNAFRRLSLAALVLLVSQMSYVVAHGSEQSLSSLEKVLGDILEQEGNVAGVSILHLESGAAVSVRGDQRFPMASTYKVPMAAYTLHLVEQGVLSLDDMVTVERRHYAPSSIITTHMPHAGVKLSLYNLLELMLTESDNTATDAILELIGGPDAVTGWLRTLGVEDMRVDRPTADIFRQYVGLPPGQTGVSILDQMAARESKNELDIFRTDGSHPAYIAFARDPQDQATPDAMTGFLARIWRHEILTPESQHILGGIMERCNTGPGRLAGKLPDSAVLAHKSGTITGTVNDVGVITLAGDKGHVVISVYVKNIIGQWEDHEPMIAGVARAAHDFFAGTAAF